MQALVKTLPAAKLTPKVNRFQLGVATERAKLSFDFEDPKEPLSKQISLLNFQSSFGAFEVTVSYENSAMNCA